MNEKRQPTPDLFCTKCGMHPAQFLMYFTKFYRDIGKEAILDAELLCADCRREMGRDERPIFQNRPNWLDFKEFTEVYTHERQMRKMGYLTSKDRWESNVLHAKHWRDRLWHLRFWWQGETRVNRRRENLERSHAAIHC